MRTGERQAERSRTALKDALGELLRTEGYGDISVGQIAEVANVGRSTFYRHFKSKADVLVALHEDFFSRLFLDTTSEGLWLADSAPESLRSFLLRHGSSPAGSLSMMNEVGADGDYLMRQVGLLLSSYVERGLRQSFPEKTSTIPLPLLAVSIAGIYGMALLSWKTSLRNADDEEMADYVHRMTRSLVSEAYKLS